MTANIAFLIEAHSDPTHLVRLAGRFRNHGVYVHLDAKTRMDKGWSVARAEFIQPAVRVYWAGYSQVEATLSLLRHALASSRGHDHFVLLSGACYPIRPIEDLEALFDSNPYRSWIKYVHVDDSAHLQTLTARHYYRDGQLFPTLADAAWGRTVERAMRKSRELIDSRIRERPTWIRCHGSSWWALTREHAQYVMDFADDPINRKFVDYYRTAFASDEQFFHTILANGPFDQIKDERIPFEGRGTFRCANLHLIDSSLQRWFSESDAAEVLASNKFFVRKVSSGLSDGLLDVLDRS